MKYFIALFLFLNSCATNNEQIVSENNYLTCMKVVKSTTPKQFCGLDVYPIMTGHVFNLEGIAQQSQAINATGLYRGCNFIIDGVVVVNQKCAIGITSGRIAQIVF